MYEQTTEAITVRVEPAFVEDASDPDAQRFVFAYTVTIANGGDETVVLRNRHWIITDAEGRMEEVQGAGVIGEQPELSPGESFTYTSGCPLRTPSGTMVGRYEMERANGSRFFVAIPAFSLDCPHERPTLN